MTKLQSMLRYFVMLAVLAGGAFLQSCGGDDPEPPVAVVFNSSSSTIMENGDAGTVSLTFADFAPEAGTITITVANGTGTEDADYTTTPATSGGTITLDVAANAQSASFTIVGNENSDSDGDRTVTFTITDATGGVVLGAGTVAHTVTITDDELPITPLSDIRAMWVEGTPTAVTEDMMIRGVVTSSNDNLTSRNFFIQDETAGIVVRTDGDPNPYVVGDLVEINLNGAEISDFRAVVQINNLPLANATLVSADNALPDYETITVAQLNSGDYQGLRVQIENASFLDVDGVATLSGNNSLTDNGGTDVVNVRVEGYAPFSDRIRPFGTGTVRGIASAFNDPQLVPVTSDDIFEGAPTAEITVSTESLEDFGQVLTNEMSAAKMYTVSATGLTENLIVDAPDGFMLAMAEDGTYGIQLSIDGSTGSITNQEVWVKFAPTSGSPATYSDVVRHLTAGAIAKTVAVTAEEIIPATTIAYTSFEEPEAVGGRYNDTADIDTDHDLTNNDGEPLVDFTPGEGDMEIGFDASFFATRLADDSRDGVVNDFVGVTDFTGTVGSYTNGTQGYQIGDPDGKMVVRFDQVDISGYSEVTVQLDLFLQNTGYDELDLLKIYVETEGENVMIADWTGTDLENADPTMKDMWNTLSADLSGFSNATLVVEFDSDSGSETIYLDNILFLGK